MSNTASRTPAAVAEHVPGLGFRRRPRTWRAALLARRLPAGAPVPVEDTDAPVDKVTSAGLLATREAAGALAVLQGHDPTTAWPILAEAALALRTGARWVACNGEVTLPTERGPVPGIGVMVAALRAGIGRRREAAGKPSPTLSGWRGCCGFAQGSITKTGNSHARRLLVESAWRHRKPYRPSRDLIRRRDGQPAAARDRAERGNRAPAAADLAAPAAAGRTVRGHGPACARAAEVAAVMGGHLASCLLDGWDALVEVHVPVPLPLPGSGPAAGGARAGPAEPGGDASLSRPHRLGDPAPLRGTAHLRDDAVDRRHALPADSGPTGPAPTPATTSGRPTPTGG